MTPVTPAAAWVCPMLDFTEPSHSGRLAGRSVPYVSMTARASIRSPSRVPVPCASTSVDVGRGESGLGERLPDHPAWARPLGAERPLLAPSWLTATARIRPTTGWPRRRASESRSSREHAWRPRPSRAVGVGGERLAAAVGGEAAPSRLKSTSMPGVGITVAPPASGQVRLPARRERQASWRATSEDEQAVSTVTAGPSRPQGCRRCARRRRWWWCRSRGSRRRPRRRRPCGARTPGR